jgi:hypothetical protein
MSNASFTMIVLSVLSTAAGLPCCLGCINYFAVPLSLATVVVGLIGLATDKDAATGKVHDVRLHLAAVIVGVICAAIGTVRCGLGGGCV